MLALSPHELSPLLLQADLGRGAEVFAGMLDDPALAALASLAPTARDLAEATSHPDPDRFLRRRAISRSLLARRMECAADGVAIGHDGRGTPFVLDSRRGWPETFLSVSARHTLFAIAFAPHRIGIDLEPVGLPAEPPWNVLALAERQALQALPPARQHVAFLEIWTAREALLKAMGVGFLEAGDAQREPGQRLWRAQAVLGSTSIVLACVDLPR